MPSLPLDGACDCHVHIVGPLERFPQLPDRNYTAAPADLSSLQALAGPLGISRFVVVQPSFYGTDNSSLLDALKKLGARGRGVASINTDAVTANLLQDYARQGVCGVRLNLYSPLGKGKSENMEHALKSLAEKLPREGRHIEIVAPLPAILSAAPAIARLPVPIVIDHYGLPGELSPSSREGQALIELLKRPNVWIKLSAPYRLGADALATAPPVEWLAALAQAAPDRCLWGSDWPHTPAHSAFQGPREPVPYRKISYASLLNDFRAALPDQDTAHRILVDNPQRLYGFSASRENA